ncbi:MAG: hypothetical protein MK135_08775, partial [Polyangiaceae bacterium]|nr:hypothetical protein [Polyangiaceae bacterium]
EVFLRVSPARDVKIIRFSPGKLLSLRRGGRVRSATMKPYAFVMSLVLLNAGCSYCYESADDFSTGDKITEPLPAPQVVGDKTIHFAQSQTLIYGEVKLSPDDNVSDPDRDGWGQTSSTEAVSEVQISRCNVKDKTFFFTASGEIMDFEFEVPTVPKWEGKSSYEFQSAKDGRIFIGMRKTEIHDTRDWQMPDIREIVEPHCAYCFALFRPDGIGLTCNLDYLPETAAHTLDLHVDTYLKFDVQEACNL